MKRFLLLIAVLALFLSGCGSSPTEVTVREENDTAEKTATVQGSHYNSETENVTFYNGLKCTVQTGTKLGGVSCDFRIFEEANFSPEVEREVLSISNADVELTMPSDDRICVLLTGTKFGGIDCYYIPQ